MQEAPFFSIVIPSRNRQELLDEAIQSVLLQSWTDYELIISNNGEPLGEDKLQQYLSDHRVRYRTSPGLSMEDHWEEAIIECRGEYIVLLTDRCLLCCDALSSIESQLRRLSFPEIVSWRMRLYLDSFGILLKQSKHERFFYGQDESRKIDPLALRDDYVSKCQWSEILPKALNCAVRRSLVDKVRLNQGRAFSSISPDITFAMACLLENPSFYFLNQAYYISRGQSSGGLAYSGCQNIGNGNKSIAIVHTPCNEVMVSNSIIEDYITVNIRYGHSDVLGSINMEAYYGFLSAEYQNKMSAGLAPASYIKHLQKVLVTSALESGLSESLTNKLFDFSILRYCLGLLKQRSRSLLSRYTPRIYRYITRQKCRLTSRGKLYSSALEAAGHIPLSQIHFCE